MIPYCKLRKDVDNLFENPDTLMLYIYLLAKSNYKDEYFEKGGFTVGKNENVHSLRKLSGELKMTVSRVRTSIKRLEKAGFIRLTRKGMYHVITVISPDDICTEGGKAVANPFLDL